MKNPSKPIPLDDIIDDENSVIFQVEITSRGLTGPLKMIESVLSKENTNTKSVSEICQQLAQTFIDIGIKNNLVHLEVILRALIRKKSNILEVPDWSRNGDPDDVTVLTIRTGLQNNPSPLVSLTYGYIKQQVTSPEFYEKKAPSHLDALYVRDLANYIDD